MKKALLIVLFLALGTVGGYFTYKSTLGKAPVVEGSSDGMPFMWGITARPSSLGRYVDSVWVTQLTLIKNLDAGWVRLTYDHTAGFAFHDEVINYIKAQGLNPYLVIEPKGDFNLVKNPYADGYAKGLDISSHYRGQIKFYQIMNEAGSNALKAGASGEKETDFDPKKYERTRDWVKGASEGIKKGDPDAYRVVTNQWLHVAFLDMLARDNVDYDVIGWDWFSDMGYMGDKKLSDGTLLINKLRSFKKPIILAECNQRPDGKNGKKGQDEGKQADYIKKMANWAWQNGLKGFFVLELLDSPPSESRNYVDYYGIVSIKQKNNGSWVPDEPRKAYETYKSVIDKYSR